MTQRIQEAGTLSVNPATKALRVCLISEGVGSSADFPREFFNPENGARLARSLSFPAHPMDTDHPEHRDPLSAIARIGETVTVEEHDGKVGFWSDYNVSKSRPEVQTYLEEFGESLGLSVFSDSTGHSDPTSGKWIAESLTDEDPFRSVDLVVAAGRGGKFEKVAESLGLLTKASATAGETKEIDMEKIDQVAESLTKLTTIVEGLVTTLTGKAVAEAQVEADTTAVEKTVESRLANYDKAVGLISDAKLTESQTAELRALALKGDDITAPLEAAKKVLAEVQASVGAPTGRIAEAHLGGSSTKTFAEIGFDVPNFGKVA